MHKAILRRVGVVLLVFGAAELALSVYDAIYSHAFSFDFTILLVGIALLRGSLESAFFIRRMAAFVLAILVCYAFFWIFSEPLALLRARLRFDTAQTIENVVWYVLVTFLCTWTVAELGKLPVIDGVGRRRFGWITPPLAFVAGIGLCAILAAVLLPMAYGRTGERALSEARAQLGPSYHYHLSSLYVATDSNTKTTHISATVAAWNDASVVDLPVTWDQ
ncbi:MAG TPA: hypothetical protein VMT54_22970 [Candidatus Cybelea sp.]|nr:hypothetical protein [Candidatus Cybelea sp.]